MDPVSGSVVVTLIAYVAFLQWLRHLRRMMIHRERVAAIEKGIDLQPVEHEVRSTTFNVRRVLLLAGLCWISLGVGAYMVLSHILAQPSELTTDIPQGMQWMGVAPTGIGLSHLVYIVTGRKKGKRRPDRSGL